MAKPPEAGPQSSPDHIEQIRDILLGPQKRDYDQRFEKLRAELNRYKEDTHSAARELQETLRADMLARQKGLEQEIQQLTGRLQEESSALQKRLEQSQAALRQEVADARAKLQAEARSLREHLAREIESQVAALRESTISRDAMAELLHELAMKVKGTGVLEELTKAVSGDRRE